MQHGGQAPEYKYVARHNGVLTSCSRDPGPAQGVGKVGGGGLMSGVVGVLVRVRRGPAGTMGSA